MHLAIMCLSEASYTQTMNGQSPHDLADSRMTLSSEFASCSERLGNILRDKPAVWMKLREGVKSDKAADRLWEATLEGIDEILLRLRMKSIEKQLSAARTMLSVLSDESRNQY
jgi:hypothetical protein